MKDHVSKRICLQILAAFLLFTIAACTLSKSTEIPTSTSTPEPTLPEIPSFELLGGTLISWWDGSNLAYVPGGEFIMGDAEATEGDNIPAHTVQVDSFWIQQIEVTNRMFAQCVAAGECQTPIPDPSYPNHYPLALYENHPVTSVTWQEAVDYCTWIGGRLPSEAEWEFAARGGTSDPYPWGEQAPNCSRLNFLGCTPKNITAPVGSYPLGLSPFKVADMAGNVFEWINDWYAADYYAVSPTENPAGPGSGELRVLRSSSFRSKAEAVTTTLRFSQDPIVGRADLGFRCILSEGAIKNPPAPICTILSYEPIPRQPPSIPQQVSEPPAFSLDTYCGFDSHGNKFGSAVIHFEGGTDTNQLSISSPQGTLHCTQSSNDPLQFACVGTALQPGNQVTVTACKSFPQTCPCTIEGLTTSQEGNHIRVKWQATPQECANKTFLELQCDNATVYGVTLPGSQTELVIDGCAQPYGSQNVCVSCIDPDGKEGESSCSAQSSAQEPTCPVFYKLNPATHLCEYQPSGLVQCNTPNVVVPGYGCLPAPQSGLCPDGFYSADYNNKPVCVPAGGPQCQSPTCMATCPKGLVFNNANLCCEYPPEMTPACPMGYTFDPNLSTCTPPSSVSSGCTSLTAMISDCEQEQPGPTGCLVSDSPTSPIYCAVPCPVGKPNSGPCTP
jgi:hypothetical protein